MAICNTAGGENAPHADKTATMLAASHLTASAPGRCPVCREDPIRPCPSCRRVRARVIKLYDADRPLGEIALATGIPAPALERIIRQERARQQAAREDLAGLAGLRAARRELAAASNTGDEFTRRERAKITSGTSMPNRRIREAVEEFLAANPGWTLDGVLSAAGFDNSQGRRFLGYADGMQSRKPIRDGRGGTVIARTGVAVRDGNGRLICDERGQPILPDPAGRPVRGRARDGGLARWSVIAIPGQPVLRVYEPTRAHILDVAHALRLLAVIGLDPHDIPGL